MIKLSPGKEKKLSELLSHSASLLEAGDAAGALFPLESALQISPRHFPVLHMIAVAYTWSGQAERALIFFKQALALKPRAAATLLNYGIALKACGQIEQAITHQRLAASLQPDDPSFQYNLALTLSQAGLMDKSIAAYRNTLTLAPDNQDALNNLAIIFAEQNEFSEAASLVARLIALGSKIPELLGRLHHLRAQSCDWSNYDEISQKIFLDIEKKVASARPFAILALPSTPQHQLRCAQIYTHTHFGNIKSTDYLSRNSHSRIRVAYFSADFFSHATAFLMAELFEKHNRERFEIFVFSFSGKNEDPMQGRIKAAVEHFIEISDCNEEEISTLARKHEIDIAIDLKGYTQHCRTGIFARRCAPIQVNYLGFPGTMGAAFMDYIIADNIIIPPNEENAFSEQVVRLPNSYQPNDRQRKIATPPPTRSSVGLPETGFVFCCFNNNYKITPIIFAIWMRLLDNVTNSVLWLFEDNHLVSAKLREVAAQHGINPDRLVFAPRLPLPEHLARHALADLFLDTFYCNAHTTASDALWAGLPVLTCAGDTFASRVAASLLNACELTELITNTHEDYETQALELANSPDRLQKHRQHLLAHKESLPLFDTDRYIKNLEKAFEAMWRRAENGLPPAPLSITE